MSVLLEWIAVTRVTGAVAEYEVVMIRNLMTCNCNFFWNFLNF
jgi:hypothetical protein